MRLLVIESRSPQFTADPHKIAAKIKKEAYDVIVVQNVTQNLHSSAAILDDFYCPEENDQEIYEDNFIYCLTEALQIIDAEYYWTWSANHEKSASKQQDTQNGTGLLTKTPLLLKTVHTKEDFVELSMDESKNLAIITEADGELVQLFYHQCYSDLAKSHSPIGKLQESAAYPFITIERYFSISEKESTVISEKGSALSGTILIGKHSEEGLLKNVTTFETRERLDKELLLEPRLLIEAKQDFLVEQAEHSLLEAVIWNELTVIKQ